MSINLHTAKVYRIEYSDIISYGNESYDVLRRIFDDAGLDVYNDKEGYSFIIQRKKIDALREELENISKKDTEEYNKICNKLNTINMDVSEFCQILEALSSKSDPNNEYVLLEWY